MKGIYCYRDLDNHGKIVYVGKDSHIANHLRHKQHLWPSRYNDQPFNRVLQNNPERYDYEVLRTGDFDDNWLSALEILYIRFYNPKFNFTVGGGGTTGYKHKNESKIKMSESHMNKTLSKETKRKVSENNAKYWKGKKHSEESRQKMSKSHKGKKLSDECKKKLSESHTKKYARIIKYGFNNGKQRYTIMKNGKEIKLSFYPSNLLEWFIKEFPKEILQIKIKRG